MKIYRWTTVHTEEDISMIMSVYTPTCCRVSAVRPALELKLAGGGGAETPTEFGNQPSGPQLEDKSWELFFWPAIQCQHCSCAV
jgi:hypothetical protein